MAKVAGMTRVSRERLAKVLRSTKGVITVAQAASILDVSRKEAAKKLAQLTQQGWLSRVRRGLYVPVPIESRTPDVALEDPWIIANQLFAPCYIGGWSAAEYWDLTDQIFRSVLIMTVRKPRNRKPELKGITFVLRTIPTDKLFGTKPVWRGQVKVNVSDTSRTIVDVLNDPGLAGGLRHVADIIRSYLGSSSKDLQLLVSYAERLGNGAIYKRLGFLLERIVPNERAIIELCRSRVSSGNSKLDPSLPAKRLVTRWRLWIPESWKKEQEND